MRIVSPENEYTVLTRLRDGRRFTAHNLDGQYCIIAVEKSSNTARRLTLLLQSWRQHEYFTDFYELFPYKNGVAAVFKCRHNGETLSTALSDMPYPRRAEVLRSLFGLILAQELPGEVLRGVLYPKNLMVLPGGKIAPLYDFPKNGVPALRETVKLICGDCIAPEIDRLYTMLEAEAPYNYAKLYETACRASDRLKAFTLPPEPEKPAVSEIIKRITSEIFSQKVAAIAAVLVVLMCYIAAGVFFYRTVIAPAGVDNGIRAIGSVEIGNGQ